MRLVWTPTESVFGKKDGFCHKMEVKKTLCCNQNEKIESIKAEKLSIYKKVFNSCLLHTIHH